MVHHPNYMKTTTTIIKLDSQNKSTRFYSPLSRSPKASTRCSLSPSIVMSWTIPPGEEYYYGTPSPTVAIPVWKDLYTSWAGVSDEDPTQGRDALPLHPAERDLREKYDVATNKVFYDKSAFAYYEVWTNPAATDRKADVFVVHGLNDSLQCYAQHAEFFLSKGYRLIAIDLPAHGRSSGLHLYLPHLSVLVDAVLAVMRTVNEASPDRKIFVAGQSMGGYTSLMVAREFSRKSSATHGMSLSGAIALCPMVQISDDTHPNWFVTQVGKGLAHIMGAMPYIHPLKGNLSEDPNYELMCEKNPMIYHKKLRLATGLAILEALQDIESTLHEVNTPFLAIHGTGDRITNYAGSVLLHEKAISKDKSIKLFEGYEHILLRKGKDEEDDARRMSVLTAMGDWLDARV